jgi:hypothetical protein
MTFQNRAGVPAENYIHLSKPLLHRFLALAAHYLNILSKPQECLLLSEWSGRSKHT